MGAITKLDKIEAGSGLETKFLELARNEDVFFKLGWHVVKNRTFKEQDFSMAQRNASEDECIMKSKFRDLPSENLGIDALRVKLSYILFEHVKKELLHIKCELENALSTTRASLKKLGEPRSYLAECRAFLAELNMGCYELCKAALGGHYNHEYFRPILSESITGIGDKSLPRNRLRAVIQNSNNTFSEILRTTGHKYQLNSEAGAKDDTVEEQADT